MKKSELLTRIALVAIVLAALFAIVLQILNEKTNTLETTYEIITFSVALLAVILAVMQGMANARTTREMHRLTREIRESLNEVRDLNRDSDKILRETKRLEQADDDLRLELKRDEKLDQESLEILRK